MPRALGAEVSRRSRFAASSLAALAVASSLPSAAALAMDVGSSVLASGASPANLQPIHLAYPTAGRTDLARPPAGLRGQCAAVHRDMRADLAALLARARRDGEVGRAIVALSCYRSPGRQARLFSRAGRATAGLPQAYQVAPPGHSEHATGLAIDFGDARRGCNLVACFAATPVGRWLAANAADFGFEMSFPKGNAQGIAFEPWHWRWVGREGSGRSARAQTIFAAARERFPVAQPAAVARVDLGDPPAFIAAAAAQPAALFAEFTPLSPRPVEAGQAHSRPAIEGATP